MELDGIIDYLAKRPEIKNVPIKWETTGYTEEFFNNWAASPAFSGWEGDRPDEEEADTIARLLEIKPGEALLDIACGYGRHATVMAGKYGQDVTGIDISQGLIAAAKKNAGQKGLKIRYEAKRAAEIAWKNTFNTAIIVNNSFSLIAPEEAGAVLEKVHRALKPGGRLFMDVDNKPFNCRYGEYAARWHHWLIGLTLQELYFHQDISVETNRDVSLVKGSDRIHEFIIFKRIYAADEITELLKKSGFKVTKIYGNWDLTALTEASPKMLLAAVKE
jgi:cyclopropane fatty-acyl-phospholipid synthase-like methyltransferase